MGKILPSFTVFLLVGLRFSSGVIGLVWPCYLTNLRQSHGSVISNGGASIKTPPGNIRSFVVAVFASSLMIFIGFALPSHLVMCGLLCCLACALQVTLTHGNTPTHIREVLIPCMLRGWHCIHGSRMSLCSGIF